MAMHMFEWKDEYAIGDETIDAEHRKLFDLAAQVFRIENPKQQLEEVRLVLHELYDYMKYHFEHEESLMAKYSYGGLEEQRRSHAMIIDEMNKILKTSSDLLQLEEGLKTVMKRWLVDHIINEDSKIKGAIEQS